MKKLSDIFNSWYGVNLELINCQENKKGIPFVARTSENNGIVARVSMIDGISPNPSHTLSLAGGGSVLSCFYQEEEYYSGRDLFILSPKESMTKIEMLLYSYIIQQNKYKYNYGRQANKSFKDILLPELKEIRSFDLKDINLKDNYFSPTPVINKDKSLADREWQWFKLSDKRLFTKIEKCKCSNATELLEQGNDIAYVGAQKKANGIMAYVQQNKELTTEGNCIVFIGDGQGSVGYSLYQPLDFIGSTTLISGHNPKLNEYNALFLVGVLDLERYRYSFGRKYNKKAVLNTNIKLPVDSKGNPDWQFMEDYIKSLPYSKNI